MCGMKNENHEDLKMSSGDVVSRGGVDLGPEARRARGEALLGVRDGGARGVEHADAHVLGDVEHGQDTDRACDAGHAHARGRQLVAGLGVRGDLDRGAGGRALEGEVAVDLSRTARELCEADFHTLDPLVR